MKTVEPTQSPTDLAEYYRNSAHSNLDQEHRSGGRLGVKAISILKEPYQSEAPGFDEWIFSYCRSSVEHSYLDIGDGRKTFERSSPGTLSIIPPRVGVGCYSSSSVDLTLLSIPSHKVREVFPEASSSENSLSHIAGIPTHIPGAAHIIDTLWAACDEECTSSSIMVDAKILELFALLTGRVEAPAKPSTTARRNFADVLEYIDLSLAKQISVAELANKACMSPTHFSRSFKQAHGESVWRYIKNRRCERAREMLQLTSEPIAQIAYACGFSSQAHLSRTFKQRFGFTPGSIRNPT